MAATSFQQGGLVLVLVLGAVLRLAWLGRKSFWLDEIISVCIARLDAPGFRNIVFSWEANMSLYYALLRVWMGAGAEREFAIRLLSAIPAILAVLVFYKVGARLFGPGTGVTAALLLAVNAFAVRYAQEARSYSQYLLLVLVACWMFLRAAESGRHRDWAGLALVLTLAIYSHFFAALFVPVLWAGAAYHPRRYQVWKPLLAASLATGTAALPLLLFVLLKDKGQLDWVPKTRPQQFYDLFELMSGHGGWPLLALSGAFLLCAAVGAVRCANAARANRWPHILLWSWLLLPIALTALASLWKPLFVPRFLLLCLPPFLLLVAAGARVMRPQWLFALALFALTGLSLRATAEYYRTGFDPPEQNWRGLVQDAVARAEVGDAMIFYHPLARLPYEYYRRRFAAHTVADVVFPRRADARLLKGTPPDTSFLVSLPVRYRRVWLVQNYGPDHFTREVISFLGQHYRLREERVYGTMRVLLYAE